MKSPGCSRNPDFWRIAKVHREKPLQRVTRAASSTLGSCSAGEGRVVCEPQWQHLRGPKLTRQKCEKQTGCHKRLMLFLTVCGCCCLKGPIVTFYCYCFFILHSSGTAWHRSCIYVFFLFQKLYRLTENSICLPLFTVSSKNSLF